MEKFDKKSADSAAAVSERLLSSLIGRIEADPYGHCPVDTALNYIRMCHSQSCGKCVPCRVGLGQLAFLLEDLADGKGSKDTLESIKETARTIADTADCAIGYRAAETVLSAINISEDDFISHAEKKRCLSSFAEPVPCIGRCPAGVDVPGYISLVSEGRNTDAVKLIRKDNPFPVSCAYICEHPCEARCRRRMTDDAVNIRGLKKYAVDNAEKYPAPARAESTGKKVAVIGGGPAGLTAAYYLSLMGHGVTVFERHKKLGGMLRYGIPSYRFPREKLDEETDFIVSAGISVKTGFEIGKDKSFEDLKKEFDAVFIGIGAQGDRRTGMDGEDADGVLSAVELLGAIGDGNMPDFSGKKVIVVGGGNVAMDATRTCVRLGAKKVTCIYRRRKEDMTAQPEEVEGALAEGAEIVTLQAPLKIEIYENNRVAALWCRPQITGAIDRSGRPRPENADLPEKRFEADVIVLAIGQAVSSAHFSESGIPVDRGAIKAGRDTSVPGCPGVFSGGDCVTGPATAIKAIAAGKAAALNIDSYLGFSHKVTSDVRIPVPRPENKPPHGRINPSEREASERKNDFMCIECPMTAEESKTEAGRCLHCDFYGFGSFVGGRDTK